MAAADQPITQKITLDVTEAKQVLADLRAEWNAMKAEMGSGVRLSMAGGGNGSAPAYAPSVNGGGLNGSSYTPPPTNGSGGGAANAGGLSAGVNVADHSDNGPAGQRRAASAQASWQNPDTGAWVSGPESVVNRARSAYWRQQERDAASMNRDAVRSVGRANRADYHGSMAVNSALQDTYANLDWMRQEVADLQARPDILPRERPFRAVGTYLLAEHAINAWNETATNGINAARSGRAVMGSDLAPAGFSMLGAGIGLIASEGNPLVAAMGSSAGQAIGNTVQQIGQLSQDRRVAAALMSLSNPSAGGMNGILGGFGNSPLATMSAIGTLSDTMSLVSGSNATADARTINTQLRGNTEDARGPLAKAVHGLAGWLKGATDNNAGGVGGAIRNWALGQVADYALQATAGGEVANAASEALGKVNDPELAAYLKPDVPYSQQAAEQLAARYGKDTAAAYIAQKGRTSQADASALATRMASQATQGKWANIDVMRVQGAASEVSRVTAAGGTAAEIGSAMGGELSQIDTARQKLQAYADALKATSDGSAYATEKLVAVQNALKDLGSQAAVIANQRATIASGERMDIAATRSTAALSELQVSVMTAKSGDASIYNQGITESKGTIDAAMIGIRDPNLTPTQRRELERQVSTENVNLFNLRRARYDFGSAFGEARARTGAEFSGLYGAAALMGAGTGNEAAGIMARQGAAQQGYANAAWDHLRAMRAHPEYYSADQMDAQKLAATQADLNAMTTRVGAAAPGLAPGEQAALSTADVGTAYAFRNGGSAAAAPLIAQSMGTVSRHLAGLPGDLNRALATARSPFEADAMRYQNAQRTADDQRQLLAFQQSRDNYQPTASLGMESDAAHFAVSQAELGPFFSTNPVGAYRNLMDVNSRMLTQMKSELSQPGLDQAAIRSRTQQMQQLQLEQMSLAQHMNYGWEGRLMQMSSNMPSYSAQYAGTFRDALLGGAENRVYGSLGAAGAARNREGMPLGGSDATWRPGDAFAQGIQQARTQTINHTVTLVIETDGGKYQGTVDLDVAARRAGSSDTMRVLMEARR